MGVEILTTSAIVAERWRRGNLRAQLRPTQQEVSDWYNATPAVLSVILARRGFGKTWFLLTKAFERMAKEPGCRLVYAAPTREMAKQITIPTANLIIPVDLPRDIKPEWVATEHAFVHPNGARLVVEGADDERGAHLRGPFAHEAYMDEMGFWRHCDFVWRSVIYPQIQRTGGRAIAVSTAPESPQHEFASILIPEAKSDGAYARITIDDDYTLTDAAKDAIAAQYAPDRDPEKGRKATQYRREFGCELVTEAERAVFPEYDPEIHVVDSEPPEFYDRYVVADIGMTDLTHVLFAIYDFDRAVIVVQDELVRQYTTVSELAPMIHAIERERWPEHVPHKRASDAQPIVLAEFARQHALQPEKVPREMRFSAVNNRDPEALINRARSLFAAKRIEINPRCIELSKQLRGGLWNERRTDFERIKGLGHLDGAMALVYTVDQIDYANNPRLAQQKFSRADTPIEWRAKPESERHRTLAKILPRAARRQTR